MKGQDAIVIALAAGTAAAVLAGRTRDEVEALMCDGCGDCTSEAAVCPAGILSIDVMVMAVRDRSADRFAAAGGLTCIRCGRCERLCPQRVPIASAVAPLQREWKGRIDAHAAVGTMWSRAGLLSLPALEGLGTGPASVVTGREGA